jgi:hypothetical protein
MSIMAFGSVFFLLPKSFSLRVKKSSLGEGKFSLRERNSSLLVTTSSLGARTTSLLATKCQSVELLGEVRRLSIKNYRRNRPLRVKRLDGKMQTNLLRDVQVNIIPKYPLETNSLFISEISF